MIRLHWKMGVWQYHFQEQNNGIWEPCLTSSATVVSAVVTYYTVMQRQTVDCFNFDEDHRT